MINDDLLLKYGVAALLVIEAFIFLAYLRFLSKQDAKKDEKYMALFKTFIERDETRSDKYDQALKQSTTAMNNVQLELARRS